MFYFCTVQVTKENLSELEFPNLLEEVAAYCYSPKTKEQLRQSLPLDYEFALNILHQVSEFQSSYQQENHIPFQNFEDLETERKVIGIENYRLDAISFLKIKKNCELFQQIQHFLNKNKEYFPVLSKEISKIEYHKGIVEKINAIFNRFGEVKNEASSDLKQIRNEMQLAQKAMQDNFNKALQSFLAMDILDDIKESVIDDQRVLAVKSAYKKRLSGRVLGESKMGSITFIQPESVVKHYFKLRESKEDEKKETQRILLKLTQEIALFQEAIFQYETHLFHLDNIQSRAQFALKINAVLPNIHPFPKMNLIDAYHPLLWLRNREENKKIYPQSLSLNPENRIICISGPNAGGKSITLKTLGLLQLMIQSGFLIPVHPKSDVFFFDKIRTDIGDNQSIENHLSTYSSRLKKMSHIIREANESTLILIDEFGTGSDPELGGALAEAFLEFFYEKQSYAIITTHYTNIKLCIEHLPHAQNAAMLFDENTLEPLYKLEIGQAGSSFTFEVAEKNKIPRFILHAAKKKVEHDIVNLDKTIVKLQQEKFEIEKLKNDLQETKESSETKENKLDQMNDQMQRKLHHFQVLYDEEKRKLQWGAKIEKFVMDYQKGAARKDLVKDFIKILEQEKYRLSKETDKIDAEKLKITKRNLVKNLKNTEVQTKIAESIEKNIQKEKDERNLWLKMGQRVRIIGSNSVGVIEKIEKNERIIVNYGTFKTRINASEIERI